MVKFWRSHVDAYFACACLLWLRYGPVSGTKWHQPSLLRGAVNPLQADNMRLVAVEKAHCKRDWWNSGAKQIFPDNMLGIALLYAGKWVFVYRHWCEENEMVFVSHELPFQASDGTEWVVKTIELS